LITLYQCIDKTGGLREFRGCRFCTTVNCLSTCVFRPTKSELMLLSLSKVYLYALCLIVLKIFSNVISAWCLIFSRFKSCFTMEQHLVGSIYAWTPKKFQQIIFLL